MIHFFQSPANKNFLKQRPEKEKRSFADKAIFCRQCLNEITYENFGVEKNNSHIHSFANPYGYLFTIRCFSSAPGVIVTGPYSSEFSWFNNYSWKIAVCRRCMTHLGWKFAGADSHFFGLIAEKII